MIRRGRRGGGRRGRRSRRSRYDVHIWVAHRHERWGRCAKRGILPPVRRWPFIILSVLSLVLCVATTALWLRSYWTFDHYDRIQRVRADDSQAIRQWYFMSDGGGVKLTVFTAEGSTVPGLWGSNLGTWWGHEPATGYVRFGNDRAVAIGWLGVGWGGGKWNQVDGSLTTEDSWIVFPHWMAVALFGLTPAVWLATFVRKRRRLANGLCRHCGYDLRATPDRCPECGAASMSANEVAARVR
jgi:hypothetical protein